LHKFNQFLFVEYLSRCNIMSVLVLNNTCVMYYHKETRTQCITVPFHIKSFQNVNNILCKQYNQMWVFF
jgi:hypothetical protein